MLTFNRILKGCLFTDGDWIESKDQDPQGNIRLIQLADIGDGEFVNKSARFLNQETATALKCTYLRAGDVIVARMPDPLGRACLFPLDGENKYVTAVDVCIIRNGKNAYNRYLMYALNSPNIRHDIARQSTGTTRKRITRKRLGELQIPLPPLEEQQQIAAILDVADELRQKDKALISKYDELTQSLFLDMFGDPVTNPMGWDELRLESVCTKITDGTHHSPEPQNSGYPYVTAKHVKPFNLDFDKKPTYIDKTSHNEIYKRCTPEFGDVLYIKDGATTGIACINTFDEPISMLSSLALLKLKSDIISNHYLCHWLNHGGVKEKLISQFMSGAAIKRYTLKKISSFVLTVPPFELQNMFSEQIQAIEDQKAIAQKSLNKSEELFNSLLQKAFKGELTEGNRERE